MGKGDRGKPQTRSTKERLQKIEVKAKRDIFSDPKKNGIGEASRGSQSKKRSREKLKDKGGGLSGDWKPKQIVRGAKKGSTSSRLKGFNEKAEAHRKHVSGRADLELIKDTVLDDLETEVLEEGKLEGASEGDANDVWLEISVLDERREQIIRQQEKMEGMGGLIAAMSGSNAGPLGKRTGCYGCCCRALAMPYNIAKREAWLIFLNQPAMRRKLETEGWVIYGIKDEIDNCKSEFEAIMLRESDVGRLYRTFEKIDNDQSGEISMKELLRFLKLDRNRFTETVFRIMDDDRNGSISFREFVIAAWNYCTLTHGTLVMFAFDLYDRDHSGYIDENEIELMLRDVYGDSFREAAQCDTIVAMLEKMTKDAEREFKKVMIDHHDFADFCRRFPGMLYPAFTLQEKLRTAILGEKFWHEKSIARTYLSDGNYISASQLLALHIQRLGITQFKTKYQEYEDRSILNGALGRSGIVRHRRIAAGENVPRELSKEQRKERTRFKELVRQATRDIVHHHHHHHRRHENDSDSDSSNSDDESNRNYDKDDRKHRELIKKFQNIGKKIVTMTRGANAFANGQEGIANGKILVVGATRSEPPAQIKSSVTTTAWA